MRGHDHRARRAAKVKPAGDKAIKPGWLRLRRPVRENAAVIAA
jgi:hypothetical protein